MEVHALLFFLSVWSHGASGRPSEGVMAQETTWQEANEARTPSSKVGNGVLTPWEPRSWSPERTKRSLGAQGHEQSGRVSVAAGSREEGAGVYAPPPGASPLPRPFVTRLVPTLTPSESERALGGLSGLYLPPTTEPPTEASTPTPIVLQGIIQLPCPNKCEFRNSNGGCDVDATCLFT
nr:uncharacterized protein LOC113807351 [Penaeus vannamei]